MGDSEIRYDEEIPKHARLSMLMIPNKNRHYPLGIMGLGATVSGHLQTGAISHSQALAS